MSYTVVIMFAFQSFGIFTVPCCECYESLKPPSGLPPLVLGIDYRTKNLQWHSLHTMKKFEDEATTWRMGSQASSVVSISPIYKPLTMVTHHVSKSWDDPPVFSHHISKATPIFFFTFPGFPTERNPQIILKGALGKSWEFGLYTPEVFADSFWKVTFPIGEDRLEKPPFIRSSVKLRCVYFYFVNTQPVKFNTKHVENSSTLWNSKWWILLNKKTSRKSRCGRKIQVN